MRSDDDISSYLNVSHCEQEESLDTGAYRMRILSCPNWIDIDAATTNTTMELLQEKDDVGGNLERHRFFASSSVKGITSGPDTTTSSSSLSPSEPEADLLKHINSSSPLSHEEYGELQRLKHQEKSSSDRGTCTPLTEQDEAQAAVEGVLSTRLWLYRILFPSLP
ncbi:hypothetical protein CBS101457_002850 [Exobasidium rhododendri]|nr:hypothetical protein CBS101457_002850 [Exobasidium rhododendri]